MSHPEYSSFSAFYSHWVTLNAFFSIFDSHPKMLFFVELFIIHHSTSEHNSGSRPWPAWNLHHLTLNRNHNSNPDHDLGYDFGLITVMVRVIVVAHSPCLTPFVIGWLDWVLFITLQSLAQYPALTQSLHPWMYIVTSSTLHYIVNRKFMETWG